jgi:hypothetical protein
MVRLRATEAKSDMSTTVILHPAATKINTAVTTKTHGAGRDRRATQAAA